jgi:hypothetical protein
MKPRECGFGPRILRGFFAAAKDRRHGRILPRLMENRTGRVRVTGRIRGSEGFQPQWTAAECRTAEDVSRLYLGCDGVQVPLVTAAEKQQRRTKIREKRRRRGRRCRPLPRAKTGADQAYKEFKVANFYDETMQHRYGRVTSGDHESAGRLMQRMACQLELSKAADTAGMETTPKR